MQLSVFVTPKDFKTSFCFTVGGDGPYEILPAAIVNAYHTFLLQVARAAALLRTLAGRESFSTISNPSSMSVSSISICTFSCLSALWYSMQCPFIPNASTTT